MSSFVKNSQRNGKYKSNLDSYVVRKRSKVENEAEENDYEYTQLPLCPICGRSLWADYSLTNLHIDGCISKSNGKQASFDLKADHVHPSEASSMEKLIAASISQHSTLPGLYHIPNFITIEEEKSIVAFLDEDKSSPWKPSSFNGHCMSKVYGVRTQFGLPNEVRLVRKNNPSDGEYDIPKCFLFVVQRLQRIVVMRKDLPPDAHMFEPNDCNANSYRRSEGDYLRPHFDDRALSGPLLMNLSLVGNCRMTFSLPGGERNSDVVVHLAPRCLQLVTGPARWDYMHCIKAEDLIDERRVSITWRKSGGKSGIQKLPKAISFLKVSDTSLESAPKSSNEKEEQVPKIREVIEISD